MFEHADQQEKIFNSSEEERGTAMKKIILIMVMILLPAQGNALEFDVWKTGEAKNKVIERRSVKRGLGSKVGQIYSFGWRSM